MAAASDSKATQSLQGVFVIAKSPLLRIHGNALFLTEVHDGHDGLDSNNFLLARGDEATTKVYESMVVGSYCDIENVIATTITKGTDRPRKIFLLTAYSKVSPSNKDGVPTNISISTCEGAVTKCIDKTLGIYELTGNYRLYLTYQYDGKSHLPSIPAGSKVIIHNAHRIPTKDRESEGMGHQESIVCCMRSSLNIKKKSEEVSSIKEKCGNTQRVLLPLCGKLYPSLIVLEWLRLKAIPLLLHKLVPDIIKMKEMLPVLVRLLTNKMTSSDHPIMKQGKRNPYEDFLSHDQSCHFSQPSKDISKTVPCTFSSVSELASCLDSPSDDLINHITSLEQPGYTCSVLRSYHLPVPMVLVAKLCCSATDGKLHLTDATGSIPCVLTQILPLKKTLKSCQESKKRKGSEIFNSGEESLTTSSFPQPSLDHLLRIDNFVLVQESGNSMDSSEISKEIIESGADIGKMSSSNDRVYVMFDPRKAVCLYRQPERVASPGNLRPRRRKRGSASPTSASTISKTFLLRSRRQLLRQQNRDSSMAGSAMPSFYCDILLLDPTHQDTEDAVMEHSSVGQRDRDERVGRGIHPKQAKLVAGPRQGRDGDVEIHEDGRVGRQRQPKQAKKEVVSRQNGGENDEDKRVSRGGNPKQAKRDTLSRTGQDEDGDRDEDETFHRRDHPKLANMDASQRQDGKGERYEGDGVRRQKEMLDDGTAGLLCFHGDAVRWYNFLREGQMYRMECKEEDMQAHVVPSIMRLSKKGMTQSVYIITSFSQLHVLQDSPGKNLHLPTSDNLSAESSFSNKGKQRQQHAAYRCISGVITRKICRASSSQEAHSSRCEIPAPSIYLTVQDIPSQTNYDVSLPANIHCDTMGLVPAATVTLRNCLMKIDPGVEIMYEVGPLTSIQVERFCADSFCEIAANPNMQPNSHQTAATKIHATVKQRSFLYHMIQDTSKDPTQVHWIYAHVSVITKLVLRWICNHCGRNDCQCINTGRQDGKMITQIVFAVDDGTGECLIWSNKPNVVSVVLGLSPRHWTLMEDCCTGPNKELVYHKWAKGRNEEYAWEAASGSGSKRSRLTLAVSRLCQHMSIQRSLWFKTRRFRESTSNKETSSDRDKSAWPTGLVLCCDEVCA